MPGDRPRIHWVSPLPPAETDIAHYTLRILPELAERADLTLWTDAETWDAGLETFCPVRHLDPHRIVPGQMRPTGSHGDRPGTVFINIGNAWCFHAGLLALARRMPSVIVLHDLALQEMFCDAVHHGLLVRDSYLTSMQHWYGEDGWNAAQQVLGGTQSAVELGQRFPGFELTMENAAAVLTHTPAASQAVAARGFLPAYRLDLPFRVTGPAYSDRSMQGPLRLVQFGHIGPNRRLEQVLEALADMGPDFDFVLDIAGKLWNPELIDARCEALGISGKVRRHGYVLEAELDALLGRAHLVFNLRHPTMGEASGSQLRIWNAAAASVVTDQGWYHDLPEDAVFRVPVDDDVAALRTLLERLDKDRTIGQSLGAAGYARLVERHGPAQYADGIAEVARAFEADTREAVLAHAARRLLSRGAEDTGLVRRRLARFF
ncbi:glycosyltransferase family protein [Roseovarius nitratireducens]|uniref:glycosyltransferase family protein n=1 Tax=Roseovarius nitratireducens TaxID=2044597 RepID=UPI000CE28536|nr:hypothetical protein [Roseovarius nitratireducens]